MNGAIVMSMPCEVSVQCIIADMKEEKPDDYDRVSPSLRRISRLVHTPGRVIRGLLLALWQRCFGTQRKE